MLNVGGDFDEGFQNEAALMHGGVGDLQAGLIEHAISKKHNIDVDGASAFVFHAEAPHGGFDPQGELEQSPGGLIGVDGGDAVKEPGLIGDVDRLSLVERGGSEEPASHVQLNDRRAQIRGAIAEVGAERQVSDFAHRTVSP
jgi:hypothetical protein